MDEEKTVEEMTADELFSTYMLIKDDSSKFAKIKKIEKWRKKMAQDDIKTEMDKVIGELERRGINYNQQQTPDDLTGLGDVVESVLTTVGITEERFKQWFNLQECNCNKRKKWLNNLFSWKKTQG